MGQTVYWSRRRGARWCRVVPQWGVVGVGGPAYSRGMVDDDPAVTNPEHYRVLWENEFVRVLEYHDEPGDRTTPHQHPNSVMVTLSSFSRRLSAGGREFDTELPAGRAVWLPAQRHSGENTGETATHTILVELKGASAGEPDPAALGPAG